MDRLTDIDPMFAENVRDGLAMTPEERFLATARLSDFAISIALAGIRNSHPNANEDEVLRILERRIEIAERLERLEAAGKDTWHENH